MAERLNHLAYTQGTGHHSPNFNPRSVSLDIRTPEELAAVNEFLITLGRDVSAVPGRHNGVPSQSTFTSPESYFDPNNLSQLGLTGMPGLPANTFSDHAYSNPGPQYSNPNAYSSRSTHSMPQQQPQQSYNSNIYMNEPSIGYNPNDYSNPHAGRRANAHRYSQPFNAHYNHPTPPLESGGSPPSSVSTPATTTPPQVPMSMPDTFDYLRPARGPSSVAQLAPHEYMSKPHVRPMIPLKSLPPRERTLPPVTQLPPLRERDHRARPAPPPSAVASSSSAPARGPLYPLLMEEGDRAFRLPPLKDMYRSPSPPSRASTPSSAESSPRMLPGIHHIAGGSTSAGPRSPEPDELSRGVGSLELAQDERERRRHAALILDLLVKVNKDFKSRYAGGGGGSMRDVEMAAA
ncbi:hypothetical protein HYPSUDRAFT_37305, partial [Hypholoma sublateritium FD-334 SS-4]